MKRSFSGDILAGKKALLRLLFCPASKKSDRIYGSFGKCCACLSYCSIIVLVLQYSIVSDSGSQIVFPLLRISKYSHAHTQIPVTMIIHFEIISKNQQYMQRTNPIWKMLHSVIDFPKCQDIVALKMRPCFVRVAASSSRPIDSAKKGKSFQ